MRAWITRVSLKDAVSGYEKDLIQDALKTTRGNCAKAARLLFFLPVRENVSIVVFMSIFCVWKHIHIIF
jgi:hypothetical protein